MDAMDCGIAGLFSMFFENFLAVSTFDEATGKVNRSQKVVLRSLS